MIRINTVVFCYNINILHYSLRHNTNVLCDNFIMLL